MGGVANVGAVIRRRRRDVHRRPVVLCAALLAPVIFAGGLLAGELSGYERAGLERAALERAEVGREGPVRGVRPVGWRPVRVPAPGRPVVVYAGLMSAAPGAEGGSRGEGAAAEVGVPVSGEGAPSLGGRAEVSVASARRRSAVPAELPWERCPKEWADTWMWEMCGEYEREADDRVPAGSARRAGQVGRSSPHRPRVRRSPAQSRRSPNQVPTQPPLEPLPSVLPEAGLEPGEASW